MFEMDNFYLFFISAHGFRGMSAFSHVDVNVNVNRMWELPDTQEQNEFQLQADTSDRLDPREDSSIFTTNDIVTDSHSHVKSLSDIQMHDLDSFIDSKDSGLKGEFAVRKQHYC